jgi:predicted small integral membrane protein
MTEHRKENLHILHDVHKLILALHVVGIVLFFVVIFAVEPFYTTVFYDFGPPFVVNGVRSNSWVTWTAIVLLLMFSRVICDLSEACFRVMTPEKNPRRSLLYFAARDGIVLLAELLRMIFIYLMLQSQISFVVFAAAIDVVTRYLMANNIEYLRDRWKEYQDLLVMLLPLEICLLLLGILILGLETQEFARVGPPIKPLGILLDTNLEYIALHVFVFGDQLFSKFSETLVTRWRMETLLSGRVKDKKEFKTGKLGAYVIVFVSMSFQWTRSMFIINFMFQQLFFVFTYFVAGYAALLIRRFWEFEFGRIWLVLLLEAIEIVFVVTFISVFAPWGSDYFSWPPPMTIFDLRIESSQTMSILLAFVAFIRVGATLHENVTENDIDSGIIIEDLSAPIASTFVPLYVVVTTAHYWLNNMILMQFILQNISFIVICAAVDIVLLLLITTVAIVRTEERIVAHAKLQVFSNLRQSIRSLEKAARGSNYHR